MTIFKKWLPLGLRNRIRFNLKGAIHLNVNLVGEPLFESAEDLVYVFTSAFMETKKNLTAFSIDHRELKGPLERGKHDRNET